MAGWTGLDHASDNQRLARLDLETGQPAKTERSEGLAGWTGLETKSAPSWQVIDDAQVVVTSCSISISWQRSASLRRSLPLSSNPPLSWRHVGDIVETGNWPDVPAADVPLY